MVSFVCLLDWAKGFPDTWQNWLLAVSMRVFLEETGIWIIRLSNVDGYHPILRGPECNKKAEEWICSLHELRHPSSPPTMWLQVLRPSDSDWITPSGFQTQTESHPALITGLLGLHNHVSQYRSYWFCVSGKLWLIFVHWKWKILSF